MDYKKIGSFIQMRRKEIGLTQKQLGEKLKVTDKAVSKWENGLGCPDVSLLGELSDILGVGIGEILNGEYNENLKDNSEFVKNAVDYSRKITEETIYSKIRKILYCILILIVFYISFMGIKQIIYFNDVLKFEMDDYDLIVEKYEEIKSNVNIINENDYLVIPDGADGTFNSIIFIDSYIQFVDNNKIFETNEIKNYELVKLYSHFNLLDMNINVLSSALTKLDEENSKYYNNFYDFGYDFESNSWYVDEFDAVYSYYLYDYNKMNKPINLDTYDNTLLSQLTKLNNILELIIEVGEKNE